MLVLCNNVIDGCHCERSEAISIVCYHEIATAFEKGLAMTTPQIKHYKVLTCPKFEIRKS